MSTAPTLPSVTLNPGQTLNIAGAVAGYDVITLAGGSVVITANVTFPINQLKKVA